MILFYVRHGDPIYNPDSLTELGMKQAQALVDRMKVCKPDRIFASSSERAIMTAKPTATYLGKEIEILDWCNEQYASNEFAIDCEDGSREWCFADEKTKRIFVSEEIRRLDSKWYQHPAFERTLFKEGVERVQSETDKFMLSLGYQHDKKIMDIFQSDLMTTE